MSQHSVEITDPPGQAETRQILGRWQTQDGLITLESLGDGAEIVYTRDGGDTEVYGHVDYDTAPGRHTIEWNKAGRLGIESYKRDFVDTKIYAALARRS